METLLLRTMVAFGIIAVLCLVVAVVTGLLS